MSDNPTEQLNNQLTDQLQGEPEQPQEPPAPATYEDWVKEQPEPVKALVETHISGLQSALASERTERKKLSNQLRELTEKAEKGSELETRLNELSNELETSDRRADFYEAASVAGITGPNIKLAWLAVQTDGLMEEFLNGRSKKVDYTGLFERMKTDYQSLFTTRPAPPPRGNAGNGAGTQPAPAQPDFNTMIRRAAGKA